MAPIKFEEHLKDKLEKRSIQPSSEAWMNLASRLERQEKQSNRKLFWWFGIAASIVILIGSSFLFFNETESNVLPVIVKNDTIETPKKEIQNTIEDIKVAVVETKNLEPLEVKSKVNSTKKNTKKPVQQQKELQNIIIKAPEINNTVSIANTVLKEEAKTDSELIKPKTSKLTFEDKKINDVVAEIQKLKEEGNAVTDEDIDELLKQAEKEIIKNRIFNESTKTVDADALLRDVEGDLEQSFRTKVFEALKKNYKTVKTAVAQRNN
jgi:hypothetical protein